MKQKYAIITLVILVALFAVITATDDYATSNIVFELHEEYENKESFESSVLKELKPTLVWKYFYDLTRIPRPSTYTNLVNAYLEKFATERGFPFASDEAGNLVIRVAATPGYEAVPSIIIQAHSDMVADKLADKEFDFFKQPIQLKLSEDGQWVSGNGTTLGADNGIGLAIGLAIAVDPNVKHGPLELLITNDEEIGMVSALKMKPGLINSKFLLNIDTEEKDTIIIGCAGGADTSAVLKLKKADKNDKLTAYNIKIYGLKGGHSGMDIHLQRANAIKLIARALSFLSEHEINYELARIDGGGATNAIPREAVAQIFIDESQLSTIESLLTNFAEEIRLEHKNTDPDFGVEFKPTKQQEETSTVFKECCRKKILRVLHALPHGVIKMSSELPGLVETSTNLARISTNNDQIEIKTSQRSSIASAKNAIQSRVVSIFELVGADITVGSSYPGWKPDSEAPLLQAAKRVFLTLYGKEPVVEAVHAGLETGAFSDLVPGIQMISYGPTITGAHSPTEQVYISDITYAYDFTKELLESIAVKPDQLQ